MRMGQSRENRKDKVEEKSTSEGRLADCWNYTFYSNWLQLQYTGLRTYGTPSRAPEKIPNALPHFPWNAPR